MQNKLSKVFVDALLVHPIISKLKDIDDQGVKVSTHTYDVLDLSIKDLLVKYKTLEEAEDNVNLFVLFVGVIIHDSSKVTLRESKGLSHSQVMIKRPDRVRKEAESILKEIEHELGVTLLDAVKKNIVHIALSHHGKWGKIQPNTVEAKLVHDADMYSAKHHRINPIGADQVVKLLAKGLSLEEVKEELGCTSGIIKDRLKRAKKELGFRHNKQLVSYYGNGARKIPIGDEFFTRKIKETQKLIKIVEKNSFEKLIKECKLLDYIDDKKVFFRGV